MLENRKQVSSPKRVQHSEPERVAEQVFTHHSTHLKQYFFNNIYYCIEESDG